MTISKSAMQPNRQQSTGFIQSPHSLRSNLPLVGLSFVFLILVLTFNGYQQWQYDQKIFVTDVERTLDNYTRQTSLIVQAGIYANQMFTQTHANTLADLAQHSLDDGNTLWYNLSKAFFNLTAAFVFSSDGHYLNYFQNFHLQQRTYAQ